MQNSLSLSLTILRFIVKILKIWHRKRKTNHKIPPPENNLEELAQPFVLSHFQGRGCQSPSPAHHLM